jgi:hypothetical protein
MRRLLACTLGCSPVACGRVSLEDIEMHLATMLCVPCTHLSLRRAGAGCGAQRRLLSAAGRARDFLRRKAPPPPPPPTPSSAAPTLRPAVCDPAPPPARAALRRRGRRRASAGPERAAPEGGAARAVRGRGGAAAHWSPLLSSPRGAASPGGLSPRECILVKCSRECILVKCSRAETRGGVAARGDLRGGGAVRRQREHARGVGAQENTGISPCVIEASLIA